MKKIIFLDIDGTLVDFQQQIPASAKLALDLAKANGHYLVLCTGRIYSGIYPWLLDYGFHGVVASTGAHVIWNEKEIYHEYIAKDNLKRVAQTLDACGASYVFQGENGRFADETNVNKLRNKIKELGLTFDLDDLELTIGDDPYNRDDIESGLYFHAGLVINQIQEQVGEGLQITGASFGAEREYNGEFTRKDINKATGMKVLLDYLGMEREDSIAFGDGPNDMEMIEFAYTGVAMGNAVDELKNIADMETNAILDDGIFNGFKRLQLI